MPVAKYRVNCSICKLTRHDQKLRYRLYQSYYERDTGDETPTGIARELGLVPRSVMNHLKKHTKLNPVKAPALVATHIAKVQTQIQKEAELAFDHQEVIPKEDYERVIDSVLSEGLDQMHKQGKQISISQLITAAKIKADYSLKKRGQDTELLKTMYAIASGEKDKQKEQDARTSDGQDRGPEPDTGGDDSQGKNGPGVLYKPLTGDAPTQRPKNLSLQNAAATNPD